MSFDTVVWVLNHSDTKGADRLVLVALASHQNGRPARPSTGRLAHEAQVDATTVFRALRRLEEAKAIEIDRSGRGRGRTSLYYVLTENVADCHQLCCKSGATPDTYLASRNENLASRNEKPGAAPDELLKSYQEQPKARVATGQIFQNPGPKRLRDDEPINPFGAGAPAIGDPCPACGERYGVGHQCETA